MRLLEILWWEKQIAYAQTNIAYLDKELQRIEQEEQESLDQLGDILAYRKYFFQGLDQPFERTLLYERSNKWHDWKKSCRIPYCNQIKNQSRISHRCYTGVATASIILRKRTLKPFTKPVPNSWI